VEIDLDQLLPSVVWKLLESCLLVSRHIPSDKVCLAYWRLQLASASKGNYKALIDFVLDQRFIDLLCKWHLKFVFFAYSELGDFCL